MLIDSHCHLDFEKYAGKGSFKDFEPERHNLPMVIDRAYKAGVTHILAIGTTLEDSLQNTKINSDKLRIFSAVGIHPDNASEHIEKYGLDTVISELEKLSKNSVCIGECGLDFHNPDILSKKIVQHQFEMFESQIELAIKVGLPLEIHSRDAEEDTIAVLKNHPKARAVIHCFSGTEKFAMSALDLGYDISFSGILTFKNANDIRDIASKVPMDRILVETDSPFLSPSPYRGCVNEPARVFEVAKCLAEVKGFEIEYIKSETSKNFSRIFNVSL